MTPVILCSGPVPERVRPALERLGQLRIADDPSEATIKKLIADAQAYIVRGDGKASKAMLEAAPLLRIIARTGVGYDNVDIAAAKERNIPVVITPGANARAVAEASMTLMLALGKNILLMDRECRNGNWAIRNGGHVHDLWGSTVGIVGFGAIGRELAILLRAFGVRILYHDPYVPAARAKDVGAVPSELDELMAASDYICLHSVLNDSTHHMINRQRIALCKRGAYLVNLSRGAIIESPDILYDALQEGRLAGVALDVHEPEPPDRSHPLFSDQRCILTPHALGMTEGALETSFKMVAQEIEAVFEGTAPRCPVTT